MNISIFTKGFKKDYKNRGFKIAFQRFLCRLIGVEDQINTLNYFLNHFHSPTQIPPASDPDLRIMQECDALLLVIFDKFCRKYQLTYWLSFGTLLGAVRHNGFIPWDDDMDVVMPRDDYNKLLNLLKAEFGSDDFIIRERKPAETIGFGFKHEQTGVWLDVIPADTISNCEGVSLIEDKLAEKLYKYRKYYMKHHKNATQEHYESKRKEMISDYFTNKGNHSVIYVGAEFGYSIFWTYDVDTIYPLTSVNFEGFLFPAPCNCSSYLKKIYGNNYMGFPKDGVLHHGEGRKPLSTWAKLNNVDMYEVKKKLQEIASEINCNQ